MGKFKNKTGHTRWQEGKSDVKRFLDKHGDEIAPVVKGIVKVAVPRAAIVIDLIEAVQKSRASEAEKKKALAPLEALLDDLDDDDAEHTPPNNYAAEAPERAPVEIGELLKLVDGTKASKFITPAITILITLLYLAMWATNLCANWGMSVKPFDTVQMAEVSLVFSTIVGIRQIIRGETKKKLAVEV